MLNKILLRKIKFPLSLRGAFSFCHSCESGNPSSLSLRGAFPHVIARERSDRSNLTLSGFSLIELMVAVTILAMAIFGIFQAYSVGFMGMADARDRTVATNYAQEAMEDIKNKPFEKIVIGGEITTIENKEEGKFSISTNVKNEIIDITERTDLQRVITTVSWKNRKGETKEVKLEMLVYG